MRRYALHFLPMIPLYLLCEDPHLTAPLREGLLLDGHTLAGTSAGTLRVIVGGQAFLDRYAGSEDGPLYQLATGGEPVRLGTVLIDIRRRAAALSLCAPFAIGPFQFIPAQTLLRRAEGGGDVILTEKETQILSYLARAAGPVGRDDLLHHIWGYAGNVDTHTVETHIYRLRQKIEADPAAPVLLVTAEEGYRLNLS